jgi:hypothetical protein
MRVCGCVCISVSYLVPLLFAAFVRRLALPTRAPDRAQVCREWSLVPWRHVDLTLARDRYVSCQIAAFFKCDLLCSSGVSLACFVQ